MNANKLSDVIIEREILNANKISSNFQSDFYGVRKFRKNYPINPVIRDLNFKFR